MNWSTSGRIGRGCGGSITINTRSNWLRRRILHDTRLSALSPRAAGNSHDIAIKLSGLFIDGAAVLAPAPKPSLTQARLAAAAGRATEFRNRSRNNVPSAPASWFACCKPTCRRRDIIKKGTRFKKCKSENMAQQSHGKRVAKCLFYDPWLPVAFQAAISISIML